MTDTDELHRLLDERGVEWKRYKPNPWTDMTAWDIDASDPRREVEAGFMEFTDTGVTLLRLWNATPEQAIDATLGRGECQIETTENWLPAERYHRCKECGAFFAALDASHDIPPRYCPNCGRKVVSE